MAYKTKYKLVMAHSRSYGGARDFNDIKAIVIHNTGNVGDTAAGNCHYFSPSGSNNRSAGAHIFISSNGDIVQSIPFELKAYAVGDRGIGKYKNVYTNSNTVSIELCDIVTHDVTDAQIEAMKDVIAYVRSICPNANTIVRHYDITRKSCPMRYLNDAKWQQLKTALAGKNTTVEHIVNTPSQLNVDGYVGNLTVRLWQHIMGTPEDGVITGQKTAYKKYHLAFTSHAIEYGGASSNLIKAVQETLGVDVDGIMGTDTIKMLQNRLGVLSDGYFGKKTAIALQERLNTGRF